MKHGYRKHLMERWSVGALERWSARLIILHKSIQGLHRCRP